MLGDVRRCPVHPAAFGSVRGGVCALNQGCPILSRKPPCAFAGLVHLQAVSGGGPLSIWRHILGIELGDYRLATTQDCGRQPLQPSRACQGLAGARQHPPTHSRRGVVGGLRLDDYESDPETCRYTAVNTGSWSVSCCILPAVASQNEKVYRQCACLTTIGS